MPKSKKALTEILQKIEQGALHFSPEQGIQTGEKLSQRQALKELRKAGAEAYPTGGMYKGQKEGSIIVLNPSEKAKQIVEQMSKKTGQESILEAKPGFEGSFNYITGKKAGTSESLGKGLRVSDKQPTHDYWTKIQTAQGPKYLEYGSGTVPGTHFGPPGLTELNLANQGSGADSLKFKKTGKPETAFQSAYALGTEPEDVVRAASTERYVANMPANTYDMAQDPENFYAQAQKMMREGSYVGNPVDVQDLARKLAKEKGYQGITWDMSGKGKITESFENVPVVKGLIEKNIPLAKQIINKMAPKPTFGLGTAWGQINEPLEKLNEPRNRAIEIASKALGKQLDLSGGKVPGLAEQNAVILEAAGQMALPASQDLIMGPIGRTLGVSSHVAAKAKPTAAEVLAAAKASPFGKVAVLPEQAQQLGKVTNVAEKVQPLGKVLVKEDPNIVKNLFNDSPFGKVTGPK